MSEKTIEYLNFMLWKRNPHERNTDMEKSLSVDAYKCPACENSGEEVDDLIDGDENRQFGVVLECESCNRRWEVWWHCEWEHKWIQYKEADGKWYLASEYLAYIQSIADQPALPDDTE